MDWGHCSYCAYDSHVIGFVKNQKDKNRGQSVTVGNGKQEVAMMHGIVKGRLVNKNGEELGTAVLTDVAYAPNMKFNLASLSRLMKNGCLIKGNAKLNTMTENGHKLNFDIVLRIAILLGFCLYINRTNNELTIPSLTTKNPLSMNEAHKRLGHANNDATREMVKGMNQNVIPVWYNSACMK